MAKKPRPKRKTPPARKRIGMSVREYNKAVFTRLMRSGSITTKPKLNGQPKVSMIGKYKAQGCHVDGMWFASKAEAHRYEQLKELMQLGRIDQLEMQVPFECKVNGHAICTYRCDFRYRINPGRFGQRTLIEDVKGYATPEYRIKRKLVEALHGIDIIEIKVAKRGTVDRCRFLTGDEIEAGKEAPHATDRDPQPETEGQER